MSDERRVAHRTLGDDRRRGDDLDVASARHAGRSRCTTSGGSSVRASILSARSSSPITWPRCHATRTPPTCAQSTGAALPSARSARCSRRSVAGSCHRDGHRPAESRERLHDRPGEPQLHRRRKAATAHGHPRPRHARPPDGGRARGVVGGNDQPVGQCHLLTDIVDYWTCKRRSTSRVPTTTGAAWSSSAPTARRVLAGLRHCAHRTTVATEPIGGAQAIWIDDERGCLLAGFDWRKDGLAPGRA